MLAELILAKVIPGRHSRTVYGPWKKKKILYKCPIITGQWTQVSVVYYVNICGVIVSKSFKHNQPKLLDINFISKFMCLIRRKTSRMNFIQTVTISLPFLNIFTQLFGPIKSNKPESALYEFKALSRGPLHLTRSQRSDMAERNLNLLGKWQNHHTWVSWLLLVLILLLVVLLILLAVSSWGSSLSMMVFRKKFRFFLLVNKFWI